MSVNLSPSSMLDGFVPLKDSMSRLRHGHQYFETLIQDLLGELEQVQTALADREAQLTESEQLLRKTQQELAEAREHAESSAGNSPEVLQKLAAADKERTALEMELESVRLRASELSENLAEQKRQMAEERSQWTTELRQMRKLLERQSQPAPRRPESQPVESAPGGPAATGGTKAAPDPVLGSVMAQFEMLQKDIARRRAKTPRPDPM